MRLIGEYLELGSLGSLEPHGLVLYWKLLWCCPVDFAFSLSCDSVISKVVPAPEAKPAPALSRPKTPPPAPAAPAHVSPAPPPTLPLPLLAPAAACPALLPAPAAPAMAASAKGPVRSVVTETVSTYVVRALLPLPLTSPPPGEGRPEFKPRLAAGI